MRWSHGADGAGPQYCQIACRRTWGEPTHCDQCPEPVLLPGNQHHAARWLRLQTQWRIATGMAGSRPTGLDYAGVSAALALEGLEEQERREAFEMIQVAEQAALGALADKRAQDHDDGRPADQTHH